MKSIHFKSHIRWHIILFFDFFPLNIFLGGNYPLQHDYSFSGYPSYPYPYGGAQYAAPTPPTPDPKTLEIFRKNWDYYSRNPQEMEILKYRNPDQHSKLMGYYQMYNHLLPKTSSTDQVRPPSRANSVKHSNSLQNFEGSSILPPENNLTHNIITPDVSSVQEKVEDKEVENFTENYSEPVQNEHQKSLQRLTPVKFSTPHVNGIFSPNGVFLKVPAKSPRDGQTATLEFHSLRSIMSRQPGYRELKEFPGNKKSVRIYLIKS